MQFQHYDLGYMDGGDVVEVALEGNAANVLLLDSHNLVNFKRGRRHQYWGGRQTHSVGRIQIPRNGHWHVVIHLGGYAGRIRSNVRKLS